MTSGGWLSSGCHSATLGTLVSVSLRYTGVRLTHDTHHWPCPVYPAITVTYYWQFEILSNCWYNTSVSLVGAGAGCNTENENKTDWGEQDTASEPLDNIVLCQKWSVNITIYNSICKISYVIMSTFNICELLKFCVRSTIFFETDTLGIQNRFCYLLMFTKHQSWCVSTFDKKIITLNWFSFNYQ